MLFQFTTSEVTSYSTTNHYTVNIGATLGQIATGGRADYLKEQLACIQIPFLSTPSFVTGPAKIDHVSANKSLIFNVFAVS